MQLKSLCDDGLRHLVDKLEDLFVRKQAGKGLSTNDYTSEEKTKLAGLQKAKIQNVKVNGSSLPVEGESVNIDLTEYALKSDISSVYTYKGSKDTYGELPQTGNKVGDTWNVETADPSHGVNAGDNFTWDGTKWDNLGGKIDLSTYAKKTDLNNKVDKVSGKGLSTNDFSNEEKMKLAGLTNYTHPTSDGNKHVPANGTANGGKFLRATSNSGIYEWAEIAEVTPITTEEIDAMF